MALLDMIAQQLGGDQIQQLSQQLGTSPQATQQAISAALPALLGGLSKNASSPDGAAALASALDRDHDGSMLDNLGGLLGMLGGGQSGGGGGLGSLIGMASSMLGGAQSASMNPRAANGDGILGHILGNKRAGVEAGISQASGMDTSQVAKLLPMLAPIVMGYLGKMKQQEGLDAGGLASVLQQERQDMTAREPALGGLMGMLDMDGDGDVMDDVGKLGKALGDSGLLGGLFGKR